MNPPRVNAFFLVSRERAVPESEMGENEFPRKSVRRRELLKQAGAAGAMSLAPAAVRSAAWAAGSDAPEKTEVKIGFIPLTDCASVVMASELGFDRKYGIRIVPTKEASWARVRDKLVGGALDAAHALYGLVYGVQLGIGGPKKDMAVLMTLNNNGQGISLSRKLADRGVTDGAKLAAVMKREPREYVFAQTFPTGTHAMWLYYWLAAHGVDPLRDASTIVVPPPQMVKNVQAGHVDAFCVGEPWNHCGIVAGASVHVASSQEIWPDHPEKVLGTTREFVERYPNTTRAMMMALLETSRWIDASPANRVRMAETVAAARYVDVPVEHIVDRILGRYQDGLGRTWNDPAPMKFHADGEVNFPWLSDGMWFLTQFKRWGLLPEHPDYEASRLVDGALWSGSDPRRYAQAHAIHA
jgi:nitrate/nitrite transport system substrate-binding protein